MTNKRIKTGIQYRAIELNKSAINVDARTVEVAFSSEMPVERYYGTEILDHSPSSIDLTRLRDGAALLVNHDPGDHVGVVENAVIGTDRVGRAIVRFGRSVRAEEVFNDVVDGIRRHISVGYLVDSFIEDVKAGTFRAMKWQPYEITFASIPADISVGVGRTNDENLEHFAEVEQINVELNTPKIEIIEERRMDGQNIESAKRDAAQAATGQILEMLEIGSQYRHLGGEELAHQFARDGKTKEALRIALLERSETRHKPNAAMAEIGMTEKEAKSFSFCRAIEACANKKWDKAGFEREASRAVADMLGKDPSGFFVPMEVQRRDMTVGTATAGGNLVATNLVATSFIEMFRNKLSVVAAGAQMLTGLSDSIAIPRQYGGATAYWVAESGAPTSSQQAVDQVTMTPKTAGGFTDISRKLLKQSSLDVELFVRNDLSKVLALAVDLAGLNGTGSSNQPRGVLQTSGIGAEAGGTNGAAPTWANIVNLESLVANVNADVGKLGYLTNTKVRGKLKQTSKVSGQNGFVWGDGDMPVNGYNVQVSNQMPSNLTKGTASGICSGIVFGNWEDLILGMWGALDVNVDDKTFSTSGTLRVVVLQDMDVAVRHAASFAAMLDALTT